MPNIKSAKKRVQLSRVSNEKNKAAKSVLHTNLKKFDAAVAEGNREAASAAYMVAVKTIDKAGAEGDSAQEYRRPEKEQHHAEDEQHGIIKDFQKTAFPIPEGGFSSLSGR